jgi:hypothetical protein
MENDEAEYIKALINRAKELTTNDKPNEEPIKEKKPKAKRNYTDEQKTKMVERLASARAKSLETRQLKASIKNGIKQETKELEKQKLQELSSKYAKKHEQPAQQVQPVQPVQQVQQVQPVQQVQQVQPVQQQQPKSTSQLPPIPPVKPMFFMPKMSHAMKHNQFKSPL